MVFLGLFLTHLKSALETFIAPGHGPWTHLATRVCIEDTGAITKWIWEARGLWCLNTGLWDCTEWYYNKTKDASVSSAIIFPLSFHHPDVFINPLPESLLRQFCFDCSYPGDEFERHVWNRKTSVFEIKWTHKDVREMKKTSAKDQRRCIHAALPRCHLNTSMKK